MTRLPTRVCSRCSRLTFVDRPCSCVPCDRCGAYVGARGMGSHQRSRACHVYTLRRELRERGLVPAALPVDWRNNRAAFRFECHHTEYRPATGKFSATANSEYWCQPWILAVYYAGATLEEALRLAQLSEEERNARVVSLRLRGA